MITTSKTRIMVCLAIVGVCLVSGSIAIGETITGKARLGYVITDEDGNQSINESTFNTYEGFGLSLEDWRYYSENGIGFTADLENITLNNRNLRATVSKPGLFSVGVTNNQYRRKYNFEGDDFTRRRSTGVKATVQPIKYVKLFGGYTLTDKHGENILLLEPTADTLDLSTDYRAKSYSVGTQIGDRYGYVRAEYRKYEFTDNLASAGDRKADHFTLVGTSTVPGYDWIFLSGGYSYRTDKLDSEAAELTTNQGWGGTKLYLPRNLTFDYRILFARSKHEQNLVETDNVLNTVSLGKNWPRLAGLRVGYENRISDDLTDRTVSNGFLASGWYNYNKKLFLRGRIAVRSKSVDDGVTLVGEEDLVRHQMSVKYSVSDWGSALFSWRDRRRTNDDIKSKVDYDIVTGQLTLKREEYGRLTLTHSYYLGKYENNSDEVSYEFSDHVFSGHVYPVSIGQLQVDFGGTYYRSRRDRDIEKFSLDFGGRFSFMQSHHLEVRYSVFNYDDFLVNDDYYTANIVKLSLIKDVAL